MKMSIQKSTETYYEGEIINMFDFSKKKSTYNESVKMEDLLLKIENINKKIDQISSDSSEEKRKDNSSSDNNKELRSFKMSVVASIIATLLINSGTILVNNFIVLPLKINETLNSIESKLDDSQNPNDDDFETRIEERISKLEVNVATIANVAGVYLYSDLEYTDDFISQLSSKTETVELEYYSSAPPCKNSDVIAIDSKSGDEYTKEQLAGEKLLIPYTYNGQEVLFYGQYSESNNWDQDCIINVYEDNKLILISETIYNNGIPSSSKQAFPSHNKEGINVWSITDRHYNNDYNYGETWNYFKFNEHLKTFEFENAEIDDIIYVSDFENDIKTYSALEGYYFGKVKDGTYTDDEEYKSYMVKYDENGFIRTLYIGNFENGDFHDNTGKAEEIVYDGSVNKYFHYIGTFTDGHRDGDNLNYVTQEKIDKIIEPYVFNCELNWYDTETDID